MLNSEHDRILGLHFNVDLTQDMRVASFFAGIGGFDLGFQRAGMEIVFHCEIDEHCQKILKRHWPEVPLHGDITKLKASEIPSADLWCAGWPCQDLSHANATDRKGLAGKRSGLFYDFLGLVKQVRPSWLVLENVPGLLSAEQGVALETVTDSLEENGYLGGWTSCNTLDAGLPHNRDRVFLIATHRSPSAYHFFTDCGELHGDFASGEAGREISRSNLREVAEGNNPLVVQRRGGFGYTKAKSFSPTIRAQTGGHQGGHSDRPILCRQELNVDRVRETDGFSGRLDGRRGRLIGNAVSPTIAEWIGRRVVEIQRDHE